MFAYNTPTHVVHSMLGGFGCGQQFPAKCVCGFGYVGSHASNRWETSFIHTIRVHFVSVSTSIICRRTISLDDAEMTLYCLFAPYPFPLSVRWFYQINRSPRHASHSKLTQDEKIDSGRKTMQWTMRFMYSAYEYCEYLRARQRQSAQHTEKIHSVDMEMHHTFSTRTEKSFHIFLSIVSAFSVRHQLCSHFTSAA